MTMSSDLASGATSLGQWDPEELFAGDAPVVTDYAAVTTDASTSFAKFEVIALKADGTIAKFDPAGAAPLNVAVGILAQPVKISQTAVSVPYFAAGYFNSAILTWPAATSTLALRKAAFIRTPIFIGVLSN